VGINEEKRGFLVVKRLGRMEAFKPVEITVKLS
jgi:hypothetical protein